MILFQFAVATVLCLFSAEIQRDWSDHALWWEQKQQWLLRTSWTLEKYGIHANAKLLFMPQHRPLKLCLPSGITLRLNVCFSNPVFQTVMGICRMLSKTMFLCLLFVFPKFTILTNPQVWLKLGFANKQFVRLATESHFVLTWWTGWLTIMYVLNHFNQYYMVK